MRAKTVSFMTLLGFLSLKAIASPNHAKINSALTPAFFGVED